MNFSYDDAGNLTSGDGLSISYDGNNHTQTVTRDGAVLRFEYDASGQRFLQEKTVAGVTTTTHYIGNVEKVSETGTDNKEYSRVYVGSHTIINKVESGVVNAPQISHVLRDRLGSVAVVVSGDTDSPVVWERRDYDAFGKAIEVTGYVLPPEFYTTPRGFTDHEHLAEVQLIHMNGRAYDYNTGRFLSVDPFIQSPTNSQSINPYSYIMNNPLSGTDPSGYCANTDQLSACAEALSSGDTAAITDASGKTVGHIGKDSNGDVFITNDSSKQGKGVIGAFAKENYGKLEQKKGPSGGSSPTNQGGSANVSVNGNTVRHTTERALEDFSPDELKGINFNVLWGQDYSGEGGIERMFADYEYLSGIYNKVVADRSWGEKLFYGAFGDPNAPQLPFVELNVGKGATTTASAFARWIAKGPQNTSVYVGIKAGKDVYVGITRQAINIRQTQHGASKFTLQRITDYNLTRNQARAIEQVLLSRNKGRYMNQINSISPNRKIYNEAYKWGEDFLKALGK